jgi:hypothetical protein
MKYLKPNLEEEWMEALRYREFERMGKRGWMEYASKNYTIISYSIIEDVLNNIDLEYESLTPIKGIDLKRRLKMEKLRYQ